MPVKICDIIFYIKTITALDFLESEYGLNIQIFKKSGSETMTVYQKLQIILDAEKNKDFIINEEFLKSFLSISVENFEYEKIKEKIGIENLNTLFSVALSINLTKFKKSFCPNRELILNSHFLAKNYGGTPWDHLNCSLDMYMLNSYALSIGINEEIKAQKEAMKK